MVAMMPPCILPPICNDPSRNPAGDYPMTPDKDRILNVLKEIDAPGGEGNIVSRGMVTGLVLRNGHVGFQIDIGESGEPEKFEALRREAETRVRALPGIKAATVVLTAERPVQSPAPPTRPGPDRTRPEGLRDVKAVIAVASGKGGVGKSTLAVNLTFALAGLGRKVGLLDADIYGPSVPRLVGMKDARPEIENRRIRPLFAHGIATMSMGYLVAEEKAMIWRGPMVASAIGQLLGDVDWGVLDILVIDMPPGTGDAQLTLAQRAGLAGAVIVSTPQDIALIDARKAIEMFRRVDVPVLGIVENMSYFQCPNCGERAEIFGHGGARETAADFDVPFLGEVPLHVRIRTFSDNGTPIVVADSAAAEAAAFRQIAAGVLDRLSTGRAA